MFHAFSQSLEYADLVREIGGQRKHLHETYLRAESTEKQAVIEMARAYLFRILVDDIFPCWYGTKWDYNGTTRTPRQGQIACGYFVTHTLTDAGFKIPKIRWAQAASEIFIKEFARTELKRFSYKPISDVESYLNEQGDGIYLAGLDNHVGYVVVNGSDMNFVHSSYFHPGMNVISETINGFNPISLSNYRVIGKLLSNEMVVRWMNGFSYP